MNGMPGFLLIILTSSLILQFLAEKQNSGKEQQGRVISSTHGASSAVAIASRPKLSTTVLETGALNDFKIDLGKMRNSLLESLEQKVRPDPADRANMVFVISTDLVEAYSNAKRENPTLYKFKTPGRAVYKEIVNALFVDYAACFIDKIKEKTIGDGKFTLTDQLETCVENLCRSKSNSGETRASAVIKGNRKMACVLPDKFNPALSKIQKQEAEIVRRELVAVYRRSKCMWDWDLIKDKLSQYSTFALQRNEITSRKRNIADIVEKWPFLFEPLGMMRHMLELTGQDLHKNFEIFQNQEVERLIKFLTIQSGKRVANLKIQRDAACGTCPYTSMLAAVIMLTKHFEEDVLEIIRCIEVSCNNS